LSAAMESNFMVKYGESFFETFYEVKYGCLYNSYLNMCIIFEVE